VQVQALGTTEPVNWLLDGRLVGTTQAAAAVRTGVRADVKGDGKPVARPATGSASAPVVATTALLAATLRLQLNGSGQHALTAMDTSGRYEQVRFEMR
jgi:membrane carboxypeptidase/penicillin-binding protein PbpC